MTALSREPQALEALVQKVCPEDIIEDARNFYDQLFEDGFLTRGNTIIEELNANDIRFSYSALEPKTIKKDFTPIIQRAKESTQDYLERHFKGKPQLASFQIELTGKCNERCVHCYILTSLSSPI
ncbi:hypothetical protein [Treponema pedis]|uniref:hypothetical protein n=1 Tax=Treponema pedis TaxID=409322 RepID=UPI0003FCD12F|nr:hypothetical protein [Treponema pedis]